MKIQQLSSDDLSLMAGLLRLFGEVFGEMENYTGNPPGEDYMRRLLDSNHYLAATATVEDRVIGGITAYVLPKYEQARSEIYIYDLAVSEAFRRQGVATALIGLIREVAARGDTWVIYIQADTGEEDQPAIELYSKLGRKEEIMHFDIDVPRTAG